MITNDTFFALRAFTSQTRVARETRRRARDAPRRSDRAALVPRAAEGRWTLGARAAATCQRDRADDDASRGSCWRGTAC